MQALMVIGYSGSFLIADAIGNIDTIGHHWGLEFMIGSVMVFGGAIAHLISKLDR